VNIIDKNLSFGTMNMNNKPNMLIVHHLEAEGANYIRLDGSVYKGRPDSAIGAHCQGCNTNTLGIAFEGNYDSRTEMPIEQYKTWCELKSYLCNKYGNMPVYGHREKGSSDCPGKNFPLVKIKNATVNSKGYIVTSYLPRAYAGYDGVDISYVLSYFKGVKCYVRGNAKGIWIETEYLPIEKCNELKSILGSWFYSIEK
jgi:N-acetylmuramoyl-L-alanine amidase